MLHVPDIGSDIWLLVKGWDYYHLDCTPVFEVKGIGKLIKTEITEIYIRSGNIQYTTPECDCAESYPAEDCYFSEAEALSALRNELYNIKCAAQTALDDIYIQLNTEKTKK